VISRSWRVIHTRYRRSHGRGEAKACPSSSGPFRQERCKEARYRLPKELWITVEKLKELEELKVLGRVAGGADPIYTSKVQVANVNVDSRGSRYYADMHLKGMICPREGKHNDVLRMRCF
jgi:hypothetical protein